MPVRSRWRSLLVEAFFTSTPTLLRESPLSAWRTRPTRQFASGPWVDHAGGVVSDDDPKLALLKNFGIPILGAVGGWITGAWRTVARVSSVEKSLEDFKKD